MARGGAPVLGGAVSGGAVPGGGAASRRPGPEPRPFAPIRPRSAPAPTRLILSEPIPALTGLGID